MDNFEKIFLITKLMCGIGVLMVLFYAIDGFYIMDNSKDICCQDIGMKSYIYRDGTMCLDYQNNAHYVEFEYESYWWNKQCSAIIFTIGELGV